VAHASILRHAVGADQNVEGTIAFYDRQADQYFQATVGSDVGYLRAIFTDKLPAGGRILDAGSGSGRDTAAFLVDGFKVDAFDASPKLAALSSALCGQKTAVASFETWRGRREYYDGIWAFASLLHVRRDDLPGVVARLVRSLRVGGWIFASFKGGEDEFVDCRGRLFTNLTPKSARRLFSADRRLAVQRVWEETASAAHGESTPWTYVLAERVE
jgi:SAM-dependent methyltransferase